MIRRLVLLSCAALAVSHCIDAQVSAAAARVLWRKWLRQTRLGSAVIQQRGVLYRRTSFLCIPLDLLMTELPFLRAAPALDPVVSFAISSRDRSGRVIEADESARVSFTRFSRVQ